MREPGTTCTDVATRADVERAVEHAVELLDQRFEAKLCKAINDAIVSQTRMVLVALLGSNLTVGGAASCWQAPASASSATAGYRVRKMRASPWPPPPQRAAAPVPPPRRRSSFTSVSATRVPDIPIG